MKVVFVVGPTASGKSEMALQWAEKFRGAIVNCDSVQLFQSLDIGSAKPTTEEFSRAPHYLFDYVEPGKEMTAGEYSRDFFSTLEKISHPVVFVVGGTGFYFQAIEKGMYPIGAADPEIIKQVEAELKTSEGPLRLHQELNEKDPETASKISLNDHYRIARAVEMMRTHGRAVSEIRREFESQRSPFPYPLLKLGLKVPKENLLPRVEKRTDAMLKAGLLDEVRSLVDQGLSGWAPLQSVGYKECLDFLNGEIKSETELRNLIIQNTMRLAKKQRTWFQRDTEISWLSLGEVNRGAAEIQEFLER